MQRVLVDSTESIVSYPRLVADGVTMSGVPSSATARRVSAVSPDAVTAYQNATVDSLSTTTQGATQEGADSLSLAGAVTIVAGRRYLVTDANHGKMFTVTATNSGSSSTMYLQEPTPYSVANGSTVKGIAVTIALSAAQTAEPGAGYVLFRATVGGIVREWDEAFRVVRRITSVALTPTILTQSYPVIRQVASNTDLTLEEAINASWQVLVAPALAARGVLDEDVLTDDVLIPMHAAATAYHLARQWPAAPAEFVQRMHDAFENARQTTWDRIDLAIRSNETETPEVPTPGGDAIRYMRIAR
jgi:hypothetical protein